MSQDTQLRVLYADCDADTDVNNVIRSATGAM